MSKHNTEENAKQVRILLETVDSKIGDATEKEVKDDFKFITQTLLKFIASEDVRILLPNNDEAGKMFFKLIISVGTEAMTSMVSPFHKRKFEEKCADIEKLLPLLKKYSSYE